MLDRVILYYVLFVRTKLDSTMRIPNSMRANLQKHIMFGSILQLQIILSGSNEMDARIASFLYENGIAFNVADSTSFISMIDESTKFAKQNPLQRYKTELTRQHGQSSRKSFRGLFTLDARLLSTFGLKILAR